MRPIMALSLVFAVGCISVRDIEDARFEPESFEKVTAYHMRGDLELVGRNTSTAEVVATLWASGSSRDRAEARQRRLRWSAEVIEQELIISSLVPESRSGVDFYVVTPELVDSYLSLERGDVRFGGVDGFHEVSADAVRGSVGGELLIDAGQVDLTYYPFDVTATVIDVSGPVTLALPFGPEYDLVVRGNPEEPMTVEDLGWEDTRLGDGFFSGYRGRGLARINIFADGPVEIISTR